MSKEEHKFKVHPAQYITLTLTREELGLSEEEFEEFDVALDKVFRKGYRFNKLCDLGDPDESYLAGVLVSKHENIYADWIIEYELVVITNNLISETAQMEYALKREILSLVPQFDYGLLPEVADEEFFIEVDSVVVDWAYSILGEDSFDDCGDHGCCFDEEYGRTCEVYFTGLTQEQSLKLMQEAQKVGAVECRSIYKVVELTNSPLGGNELRFHGVRMEFSIENARKVFGPFMRERNT